MQSSWTKRRMYQRPWSVDNPWTNPNETSPAVALASQDWRGYLAGYLAEKAKRKQSYPIFILTRACGSFACKAENTPLQRARTASFRSHNTIACSSQSCRRMPLSFEACFGWLPELGSSSGAWNTRHCLLAGWSIGELGETLCCRVIYRPRKATLALLAYPQISSGLRIDRTFEEPVETSLVLTCCLGQTAQL